LYVDVPSPAVPAVPAVARVRSGLCGLAVALHLLAVAYLLLCTRDRADWTIGVFKRYGDLMRAGHIPYRDFTLEYPPLAAPLLWLPSVVARGAAAYRLAFAGEALAFDLLGVGVGLWLVRRAAPHSPPWGLVLAQPLWLLCAGRVLVCDRFDLPAAVLTLLALALLVARRPRLAWGALGLAVALKLYPLVLLPLFALVALSGGRRGRLAGDLAAFVAAILAPAVIVARGDLPAVATFLTYHVARGLEIETVAASAVLVGRALGLGGPVSQRWGHGGNEIVAPLAPLMTSLTLPLTVLALGAVYRVAWRRRHRWADTPALVDDLARLSAAAVLAFMLAGKVLSPQYLLWLYPLVAVVSRRPLTLWAVYGLALLLTGWIFPAHYYLLVRFAPREVLTLVARNGLLLVLAALVLRPRATTPARMRRRTASGQSAPLAVCRRGRPSPEQLEW